MDAAEAMALSLKCFFRDFVDDGVDSGGLQGRGGGTRGGL